ncbi:MAG: DNA alkylation repair protein [Salinivirgaceae bacterium]|jgi:hypothetical protein
MVEHPISIDTIKSYKDIMHSISRMQNGEISKILSKMGIEYRLNYGVSIPHLRQLVTGFEPNNELAFILWEKDIRETKILASILFENNTITFEQAIEIAGKLNNHELVEQFSRNLFSRLPFLILLMEQWLEGTDWEKMLALYSAGWYTKHHDGSIDIIKKLCYCYIDKLNAVENNPLHQSLLFILQSLSMHSELMRLEIKEKAQQLMSSENCSIRRLGEEFLWLNVN